MYATGEFTANSDEEKPSLDVPSASDAQFWGDVVSQWHLQEEFQLGPDSNRQ